jgi:hypothetical protein
MAWGAGFFVGSENPLTAILAASIGNMAIYPDFGGTLSF